SVPSLLPSTGLEARRTAASGADRSSAHPGWLRWELPVGLSGALPHVVQPVRDPVGAMHRTLGRGLIPRGVCQSMALPTSEVTTTKYSVTAAPTVEAHEPLPPAAEPGRRVCEGHELVDTAPLTV